jgi:BRCA1-associated protein
MRIIRDTCPNQYMTLFKFKNQKDADFFYSANNNKMFNSIEENVCHLVYVEKTEAINSSKGASMPIPGFSELPTCYICLERMDESLNGVITILCNHSFHANCLSKWGDDSCCPVCRYSQTPECSSDNVCSTKDCGSHESLWICLVCGNIGCGRYERGHAYDHFRLTQHTYSMQLGSNRVWDYAGDNYVHRLIQNKTDGKLVRFDEGGRMVIKSNKQHLNL